MATVDAHLTSAPGLIARRILAIDLFLEWTDCTSGKWSYPAVKCAALPPITCPDTRAQAAGQVCPTEGAYCTYGDLTCQCTNCNTGGPVSVCSGDPTWHCATPNPDPACPQGIPMLGSACTSETLSCTYGCGSDNRRICTQGVWYATNGGPCPVVSSRRADGPRM